MAKKIRFGDFIKETSVRHNQISYSDLMPAVLKDEHGNELDYQAPKIKLKSTDVYKILKPYVSVRFIDQIKSVVPLAVYLIAFQILILQQEVTQASTIAGGLVAVILGLMFFMEGLQLGLMPFGEMLGNRLPSKASLAVVLIVSFLLGVGVTFAEPAISALKAAGQFVKFSEAPVLYQLLNEWAEVLVLFVGIGVGIAAVLGTLRFIYGWSMKPFVYFSITPTLLLTIYMLRYPELKTALGLAWDCGAVTTGPVTVPLVLALGIGVAASTSKGDKALSGFGIVTLASVFPILAVMILSIIVYYTGNAEIMTVAPQQTSSDSASTLLMPWYSQSPAEEIILGLRAILPLVVFLFLVLKLVVKEQLKHRGILLYGITLTVVGMIIFNLGLTYGLSMLGGQSGGLVPAAFTKVESVQNSPLYIYALGICIAVGFAWFLGFGATLAEPALNALGITVETLTNGAFKKKLLMYAVSIGVGFGLALGVTKIIYEIPIEYLILPGYALALILTWASTEEFVNIAWDSAGVTTGPITVPLVLAMGLAFGDAVHAVEGFGILSMASICPILSVLICGLWIEQKTKKRNAITVNGATND